QRTTPFGPVPDPSLCQKATANDPVPNCWLGLATGAYGEDAPAQLAEDTINSQNPNTGAPFVDQNDPRGGSLIDFDVSHVDHAYLPVAMSLGDTGATQFMGPSLSVNVFNQQINSFVKDASWSQFAAWSDRYWSSLDPSFSSAGTSFRNLILAAPHK